MKSILESTLLYACVNKLRDLDKKTNEVLASFVYVYWMLKFSEQNPTERLNIAESIAELWCLVFNVFTESKTWSHQHVLIAEELLKLARTESIEAVRRMAMITTIEVDIAKATEIIESFSKHMNHSFGNQLTWNLNTKEDAVMEIAAKVSK